MTDINSSNVTPEPGNPASVDTHPSWESITTLFNAIQETNLDNALTSILKTGQTQTGASFLGIFLAEGQHPILKRIACVGEDGWVTEDLPAQDLAHLSTTQLWAPGKRILTTIHRLARRAQLSYLASTPIGQLKAAIGLLVVGWNQPTNGVLEINVNKSLPILETLAAASTLNLQTHVSLTQLRADLNKQIFHSAADSTIQNHTNEGVILLDIDLMIIKINPSAEMVLGYASREVVGETIEKVLIGPETLIPALNAAQAGSATYNLGDVLLYRRDGEAFPALVRVFPVMNEDQVLAICVLIYDQSEQEQIRAHVQQLEQRAILGEVTAIFAHEVRNPVNSISTGLQLMDYNLPEGDPNHETIARLLQECDRLAELITTALAYSRPTEYKMEPVDLAILLQQLLERLHPRIAHLNVKHNLLIDPGCSIVMGNLKALDQVFSNLINNALQAMGENGGILAVRVQSLTSPEGHAYVEASVADTGPGIPKEMQERIFQPFFTTKDDGTGLGLAVVKRIVLAHKGTLRLTSFPGGTIFHVQIPANITNAGDFINNTNQLNPVAQLET